MPDTIAITVNVNQHLNSSVSLSADRETSIPTLAPQRFHMSTTSVCCAMGAVASALIGSIAWSSVGGSGAIPQAPGSDKTVVFVIGSIFTATTLILGCLAYRWRSIDRPSEHVPYTFSQMDPLPATQNVDVDGELGVNPTRSTADEDETRNNLATARPELQIEKPSGYMIVINPDQSIELASQNNIAR